MEGVVTDQVTGAPLRKAMLTLRKNQTGPNDAGSSYTASSDAGGHYTIADVDPGRYSLSVEKTGYVTARYGSRGFNMGGALITLDKKQKIKDIDFKLIAHAVIVGRVLDDEGDPVANVSIQTMRWGYVRGKKQLVFGGANAGNTNDLGEFRIFGLAPGKYILSATYRSGNMNMDSAQTRGEETFAQTYYPAAATVDGASTIEATAGAQMRGFDVHLRKSISVAIRGRVIGPPELKSLRNVNVMLVAKSDNLLSGYVRNFSRSTGPQGDFVISRVTPGTYTATAMFQEDGKTLFGSTTVEVGNTGTEGVVVELGNGLEVRGTVKIEGNGNMKPTDIRLNLMPKTNSTMFGGQMQGGEPKEDGKFTYTHVPKAHFDVGAYASSGYLKSVQMEGSDITDTGLDLSAAAGPTEITLVYSTDDGQIDGTLETDTPGTVPKASIVIVPEGKRRERDRYYALGSLDQTGHFTIKRLAPGEYRVFAFDAVEFGAYMDPDWLKRYESKGEKISVKEGGRESVQLKLIKTDQ